MPFNQAAIRSNKLLPVPEVLAGKGRIVCENESVSSDAAPACPRVTARLPQPRHVPAPGADRVCGHCHLRAWSGRTGLSSPVCAVLSGLGEALSWQGRWWRPRAYPKRQELTANPPCYAKCGLRVANHRHWENDGCDANVVIK